MFLEPEATRRGYGRLMWNHAIAHAAASGFAELLIESDRFAEPFHVAMGDPDWVLEIANRWSGPPPLQNRCRSSRTLIPIAVGDPWYGHRDVSHRLAAAVRRAAQVSGNPGAVGGGRVARQCRAGRNWGMRSTGRH